MDTLASEYGWDKYGESYCLWKWNMDLILDNDFKIYVDFIGITLTIKKDLSNSEKKQILKIFGDN